MVEASVVSVNHSTLRLEIRNISNLTEVFSEIQVIQDIPWKIRLSKTMQSTTQWLGVHLYCAKTDTSSNWSNAASATFKLISHENVNIVESTTDPFAFNITELCVGFTLFIKWNDLIDPAKHFVTNDAIQLDVNIEAADPHEINQSILINKNIQRCCSNDCLVTFELTVINISNLLAVRSTRFILRGLLWDISVYKDHSNRLGVRLDSKMTSNHVSCNVRMTTKLRSSNQTIKKVEQVETKVVRRLQSLVTDQLIAWNEMFNIENQFVEDDMINLLIEIKADKPELGHQNGLGGDELNVSVVETTVRMECAMCLENICNQDVSCPPCGHVFCSSCISDAAKYHRICPSCNIAITLDNLRRVFLPM